MAEVRLEGVTVHYGAHRALHGIDLAVSDGEFAVFVGPSGCGKSTLLRAIAGLEDISGGQVSIGGRDVSALAPSERDVSMVFQSYALYPHMTVRQNIDFGMKINKFDAEDRRARIAEAARVLQLGDYLDRKPGQLSGGQRQRVAIGRAIVKKPAVFLFDEPLSNLDAKLRVQMRVELEALHRSLDATMIYVTHDQVEAMTMADKIVVLRDGRIEQVGAPMDLYHHPRTEFVAGFIGAPSMNILDLGTRGAADTLAGASMGAPVADAVRLGIRPEHAGIVAPGAGDADAEVALRETLGGDAFVYARLGDGQQVVVRTDGDTVLRPGERVGIAIPAGRRHYFTADGATIPRMRVPA